MSDHPIQDGDPDGSFGLLTGQCAGMKLVAEDALKACHRGFRLRPLAIVGLPLPLQPAPLDDGLDVTVPLGWSRLGGVAQNRRGAWRNHHPGAGVPGGNGLVTRVAVVDTVFGVKLENYRLLDLG